MAQLLRFEGFEVIEAADGRAGVVTAVGSVPDLIVCDIMMPELDGFGVLQALRDNPRTAMIPFIFLTALGARRDRRHHPPCGRPAAFCVRAGLYRRSAPPECKPFVQGQHGRTRHRIPSGGTPCSRLLLQPFTRRPPARLSCPARGRESRARILPPCRPRCRSARRTRRSAAGRR